MPKSKNLLPAGKFTSVLQERCPRCRKGHMFKYARYNLRDFDKMYKQCSHCGLNFELEPGFYTGAMYVSYAFSVVILIIVGFFLLIFFNDPGIYVYVITTLIALLILFPVLFRYSRVIYLHVFGGVKYRPDYQEGGPFMKDPTPSGD